MRSEFVGRTFQPANPSLVYFTWRIGPGGRFGYSNLSPVFDTSAARIINFG